MGRRSTNKCARRILRGFITLSDTRVAAVATIVSLCTVVIIGFALSILRKLQPTREDVLPQQTPSPTAGVHVVYASDQSSAVGVEASIRSAAAHAKPGSIRFTYIGEKPLSHTLPEVDFIRLSDIAAKHRLEDFTNPAAREERFGNLNTNLANFARFALPALFPSDKKVVWMDADTIVRCDMVPLVGNALETTSHAVAAVPRKGGMLGLTKNAKNMTNMRTTFNAGMYIADLERWRERNITNVVRNLALLNRKKKLYSFGSQPPLSLAIGENFEHLPKNWNVGVKTMTKGGDDTVLDGACMLHWKGFSKPWDSGYRDDLWLPYANAS